MAISVQVQPVPNLVACAGEANPGLLSLAPRTGWRNGTAEVKAESPALLKHVDQPKKVSFLFHCTNKIFEESYVNANRILIFIQSILSVFLFILNALVYLIWTCV